MCMPEKRSALYTQAYGEELSKHCICKWACDSRWWWCGGGMRSAGAPLDDNRMVSELPPPPHLSPRFLHHDHVDQCSGTIINFSTSVLTALKLIFLSLAGSSFLPKLILYTLWPLVYSKSVSQWQVTVVACATLVSQAFSQPAESNNTKNSSLLWKDLNEFFGVRWGKWKRNNSRCKVRKTAWFKG